MDGEEDVSHGSRQHECRSESLRLQLVDLVRLSVLYLLSVLDFRIRWNLYHRFLKTLEYDRWVQFVH